VSDSDSVGLDDTAAGFRSVDALCRGFADGDRSADAAELSKANESLSGFISGVLTASLAGESANSRAEKRKCGRGFARWQGPTSCAGVRAGV
jgi:hypothetical protein